MQRGRQAQGWLGVVVLYMWAVVTVYVWVVLRWGTRQRIDLIDTRRSCCALLAPCPCLVGLDIAGPRARERLLCPAALLLGAGGRRRWRGVASQTC